MRGRNGRIDVREGGFLEALEKLERLEVLEGLERLEARRRAMAKLGRKRNNIARYTRAYAHITRVLYFLLSQVSPKHYNPLYNNHLH